MFRLFTNDEDVEEKGGYEERSHQDNFSGWDNGSYQYCRSCGCETRFEWDRCSECKNN